MLNVNDYILTQLQNCITTANFNLLYVLQSPENIYTSKASVFIQLDDDMHVEAPNEANLPFIVENRIMNFSILCGFKIPKDTSRNGKATDTANDLIDKLRKDLRTIKPSNATLDNGLNVRITTITYDIFTAIDNASTDNAILVQGKINYTLT